MCRQIEGASDRVAERVVGTKGWSNCRNAIGGEHAWMYQGVRKNPYVLEHRDLIQSIRTGEPLNEAERMAESTLCAIMGREAAYSRQQFKQRFFAKTCTLDLRPPPAMKLGDSRELAAVPVPGEYTVAGCPTLEPKPPKKKKDKEHGEKT
jgi:hypothetical protein